MSYNVDHFLLALAISVATAKKTAIGMNIEPFTAMMGLPV